MTGLDENQSVLWDAGFFVFLGRRDIDGAIFLAPFDLFTEF